MGWLIKVMLMGGFSTILCLSSVLGYDECFEDKSMRVDYYHTGTADQEMFSIDRIYEEPHWGGSKKNLIDITDLGKYMIRLYDVRTNQLIYSRGFSSIYGEWETTGEASEGITRTFHETAILRRRWIS
jgi:hypothetical protein